MKNNLFYIEEEKKEEEKVDMSINTSIWPYGLSGAYNWGGGGYTWATYGAGAYNGMISWGNWVIENKYLFENRYCF